MIIITEFMDEAAIQMLRDYAAVHYDPTLADRQHEIAGLIAQHQAQALIVRNRTQVNKALIEQAGASLNFVGRLGVGLDNIDQDQCKQHQIQVFPATGANSQAVCEFVIGACLVLRRKIFHSTETMIAGDWPRPQLSSGLEVFGAKLGLIGFGDIAFKVAKVARALGMELMVYDPFLNADSPKLTETDAKLVDLPLLLTSSDIVSLHVPLTPATHHLIDQDQLQTMKRGAILINTARGGVVNEAALAAALKSNHLSGAALDVFASEPASAADLEYFAGLDNVILTPHIAGVTQESNQRVSHMIARSIITALKNL
ncbi:MAG: hydroxyacid dehydrogenase [Alphaproteobacteria bacterium]